MIYSRTFAFGLLIFSCVTQAEPLTGEPIQPLPEKVTGLDQAKVNLGQKLYNDKRLSSDNTVACVTCHQLDKGGTDLLVVSKGIKGQLGDINAPTVFNSRYNFVQFWDGRAKNLEEQAAGPVENPAEMGNKWDAVVKMLAADSEYSTLFQAAYHQAPTKENTTQAIAEFERSLVTPSRFDDYLRGDANALSDVEKRGYATFKSKGCTACHNGINVGGAMYQKMGLIHDYFADRGSVKKADYGRFNVTHDEKDKFFFKVPTLRNVALTPPYFHDGSVKTLPEAVKKMGHYQLGQTLSDNEINDIVAFLGSLTGKDLVKH